MPHKSIPQVTAPSRSLKLLLTAVAAAALSACSTVQLQPLEPKTLADTAKADATAIRKDVEPLPAALTLEEAMARALKYNLDRRARMMEEALALGQFDVSKYDMLPKLVANAGYSWRNNDKISLSRNSEDGTLSPSRFISTDRDHNLRGGTPAWRCIRCLCCGVTYQLPMLGMLIQGSAAGRGLPFCSNSMLIWSGLRTKAMRPSLGGRLISTPCACSRAQVS